MKTPKQKAITITERIGDKIFSVLADGVQAGRYGGYAGAILGLFVGIVFWFWIPTSENFGLIEAMIVGAAFVGLIGLIIGGIIGVIIGVVKIHQEGQFYELYVRFMVWLGVEPPPEYERISPDAGNDLGIKKLILRVSFWISFWAIEGIIVGAIGGAIFGLFGFGSPTFAQTIFLMALWTVEWAILGMIIMVIVGPFLWLVYQVMKKISWIGSSGEIFFLMVGGKIGERLFERLFGNDNP
jgi:hypothetical protein